MKVTEKKTIESITEFKFDNGAWARIVIRTETGSFETGSFEYQEDVNDDGESYEEGGLWFNDKTLEDYDGVFELPEEIKVALKQLGYELDI